MTAEDWTRLETYAAESTGTVHLDRSEFGTCVVVAGFGVFHPKTFLELIDDLPSADCRWEAGQ